MFGITDPFWIFLIIIAVVSVTGYTIREVVRALAEPRRLRAAAENNRAKADLTRAEHLAPEVIDADVA